MPIEKSQIMNFHPKMAGAYPKNCVGCRDTGSDVMLSFGNPTPYGGDNRPAGPVEVDRVVDVFLDRAQAERLYRELGDALGVDR